MLRGMTVMDPGVPIFTGHEWKFIFEKCVERNIQFVLLIDPAKDDTHGIVLLNASSHHFSHSGCPFQEY